MSLSNLLEEKLLTVRKPARYLGNELNAVHKDFDEALIRFALCFPDSYEVGMSNLGLRILYGLLNSENDLVCERVFSPAPDMQELINQQNQPPFSLESKRSLKDFDLVGFSLGYELSYTNVLNLLHSSGIPLRSNQREDNHPLVVAGGPCVLNPEPISEFIDFFLIGEAEEALLEVIAAYRKLKENSHGQRPKRGDFFNQIKDIEGVYIPAYYSVSYNDDNTISKFSANRKSVPGRIKKRFLKNLDCGFYPVKWLVPLTEIIHDRISLEIMRGCPNQCNFCQARAVYFPYRKRSPEKLIGLAEDLYQATGYEEISLAGLSISDYSKIKGLLEGLIALFKQRGVSVSFASMKAKTLLNCLVPLIVEIKKTGLTFAPEAGSEKLRKIINKNFDLEAFFSVAQNAYNLGYQHIKLYFMIGLPCESDEDLNAIVDLSNQVRRLKKSAKGRAPALNLSVATFIPKPHTPFQWLATDEVETISKKQAYLRKRIKKTKLSFHNREMSFIEALLSRGDRKVADVIYRAWEKGARFDAWDEHFSFRLWLEAIRESGCDASFYVNRRRSKDEILPWDFIDPGVSKNELYSQLEKAGV